MKYLKLFNLQSEYDSYKESSDFVTPNVSLIEEVGIQYNPITPSQIKGIHVVEDISEPVYICWPPTVFKSVKIEGNEVSLNEDGAYQFDTPGTYTVELELKDVTRIEDSTFSECYNLTSIIIPESVTSIGNEAFYQCSSLTSINIPEGVTSIGQKAFQRCSGLTSITLPTSLTSIGNYAFDNCSSLTSITLSEGVTSIGECAFYGCRGLTSITCHAVTPPTIGSRAFFMVDKSIPVYVPAGAVEAYQSAEYWSSFTNIQAIPEI